MKAIIELEELQAFTLSADQAVAIFLDAIVTKPL